MSASLPEHVLSLKVMWSRASRADTKAACFALLATDNKTLNGWWRWDAASTTSFRMVQVEADHQINGLRAECIICDLRWDGLVADAQDLWRRLGPLWPIQACPVVRAPVGDEIDQVVGQLPGTVQVQEISGGRL